MAEEGDGVVRRLYSEFITIDRSSATIAAASANLDSLEVKTGIAGDSIEELGNLAAVAAGSIGSLAAGTAGLAGGAAVATGTVGGLTVSTAALSGQAAITAGAVGNMARNTATLGQQAAITAVSVERLTAGTSALIPYAGQLITQTEAGAEYIGRFRSHTDDADGAVWRFIPSVETLRNALLGLGAALTAAGVAGMLYFSTAAKEYGKYATAQTAYVTMVGDGADQMLANLQAATRGAVSEYDLILAANRAVAMGISEDALPRLAEIAQAAGRIMGTDTTSMFNDIVTGIARGSPLILDNLGIVISIGDANERYAASIGKASDALTEEEQQAALLNEVLIQGQRLIDNAGSAGTTAAGAYAQMTAAVENLNIAMGAASSGPMSAWYNLLANIANTAANLPAPVLAIASGVGLLGSAASSIIGPLMLQAAALLFLRQQWAAFRAEMATTPAFAAVASVSLGSITASLYATAAAAWAALVPLLPLIGAIAAVAGVGLAIDYGVRGDESLIGTLLSPTATSDTLTTNTVNVTQYNTITQENDITTSQSITDADIDSFMRKSKARLAEASDEALRAGLTAYL